MSTSSLITNLALVVLFSSILFFYFNNKFKYLDSKLDTFMDMTHNRLVNMENTHLPPTYTGGNPEHPNTIHLSNLNEEYHDSEKITVSEDDNLSDSEYEDSDSDSDSDSDCNNDDIVVTPLDNNTLSEEPILLIKKINTNVSSPNTLDEHLDEVYDATENNNNKDDTDSLDGISDDLNSDSDGDDNCNITDEKKKEIEELQNMTILQLKDLAKERNLTKYKSLTKNKLVELLNK
jgi:hypothetical protein